MAGNLLGQKPKETPLMQFSTRVAQQYVDRTSDTLLPIPVGGTLTSLPGSQGAHDTHLYVLAVTHFLLTGADTCTLAT